MMDAIVLCGTYSPNSFVQNSNSFLQNHSDVKKKGHDRYYWELGIGDANQCPQNPTKLSTLSVFYCFFWEKLAYFLFVFAFNRFVKKEKKGRKNRAKILGNAFRAQKNHNEDLLRCFVPPVPLTQPRGPGRLSRPSYYGRPAVQCSGAPLSPPPLGVAIVVEHHGLRSNPIREPWFPIIIVWRGFELPHNCTSQANRQNEISRRGVMVSKADSTPTSHTLREGRGRGGAGSGPGAVSPPLPPCRPSIPTTHTAANRKVCWHHPLGPAIVTMFQGARIRYFATDGRAEVFFYIYCHCHWTFKRI